MLQIDHDFTLPCGFVDEKGDIHRDGVMRLATALDEVEPFEDGRVHRNGAFLSILLISRTLLRLGSISPVPETVVQRLFAADFTYLQELYLRINDSGGSLVHTDCPVCGTRLTLDLFDTVE